MNEPSTHLILMTKLERRSVRANRYRKRSLHAAFFPKIACRAIKTCLGVSILISLAITISGCSESIVSNALPAPLRTDFPYELKGPILNVWGGDHFDFGNEKELHYVEIRGVDCPPPGKEFHNRARRATADMVREKFATLKVHGHTELKIEISDVYVRDNVDPSQDLNVGLELIKRGLGWHDGNDFELAEAYRDAESTAKQQKLGLWAKPKPSAKRTD